MTQTNKSIPDTIRYADIRDLIDEIESVIWNIEGEELFRDSDGGLNDHATSRIASLNRYINKLHPLVLRGEDVISYEELDKLLGLFEVSMSRDHGTSIAADDVMRCFIRVTDPVEEVA